ncbi:MAG: dihydroorotase family protein [Candidatus Methanomethylophilaceae archaeon]|nr:dihydroorotase family protein [Candidatus Methanomethylophilaceae archaeon]
MTFDLVVRGDVFVGGETGYREIGIEDGRIAYVGRSAGRAERVIDAGPGKVVLPGFTDPHVHFRDPGMTHKEDFSTGTMSAAFAGVTCILDMPNTLPPVTDLKTLEEKKSAVRGRAYVDYGLFAAVTAGCDPLPLAPLVPGFKLFMGSTTGDILLNDDADLVPAVARVLGTGKRMSVHAEDDSMISREEAGCTRDHLRNRPESAETNAIGRLASRFSGSKINICHITTSEGLDVARSAGFTTEVTLHHLMFDVDGFPGAEYKVNPPIRCRQSCEALYRRFLAGDITMFGSDHAPHTMEEKGRGFQGAPGGIPGVETTVPIAMEMVRRDEIPLSMAVRMGAEAPAEAFSIRKGRISPGYDADLCVFDLRSSSEVDVRRLHSRCGHSPYAGFRAVFPDTVIIRGEVQVDGGEFCGDRLGSDVCGRLRSRLFGSRGKEGRLPRGVRHVLPLPARGPARGEAVLQIQPSPLPRKGEGPGAAQRPCPQERVRVLRIPQRPALRRLRASYGVLQAVPLPSLRQRPSEGGAGPLMQGGLDRDRQRRPRRGEGPGRQGFWQNRGRIGAIEGGVPRVLRQLPRGGRDVRPFQDTHDRVRERVYVHRLLLSQPHNGHGHDRAGDVPVGDTPGDASRHALAGGGRARAGNGFHVLRRPSQRPGVLRRQMELEHVHGLRRDDQMERHGRRGRPARDGVRGRRGHKAAGSGRGGIEGPLRLHRHPQRQGQLPRQRLLDDGPQRLRGRHGQRVLRKPFGQRHGPLVEDVHAGPFHGCRQRRGRRQGGHNLL